MPGLGPTGVHHALKAHQHHTELRPRSWWTEAQHRTRARGLRGRPGGWPGPPGRVQRRSQAASELSTDQRGLDCPTQGLQPTHVTGGGTL